MMAAQNLAVPKRRPLILIVEDDTVVARDLERTLRSFDYDVLGRTTTAADAIRQARARRPDVVLMDIRLPGDTDAVGAARLLHDELGIAVIFLSAFSDLEAIGRANKAEPFGYLVKPFKETDLRCAIELALRRGRTEAAVDVREQLLATAERLGMGDAQREAELRFRRLFDSGIIGISVATISGAITEANDTFLEMIGYSRDDLRAGALTWKELTPIEWHPLHALAGEQLRACGSARPFEKEYLRRDGTRVPVLVGLALLDENRVLTTATDLTERKRAEARKLAVVDAALDSVVGMDHAGKITEFNPAAERTFGYARAEALGRTLADLIIPLRFREAHVRGLEHFLAGGEGPMFNRRTESYAMRRDGVEIPIELSIARINSSIESGFVGFIRDISERRRVEAALLERVEVAALSGDIGLALTDSASLQDILRRCCEAVVLRLGASVTRVWTVNSADDVLELQASAGKYTHIDGRHARVSVGQLEIGLIAAECRPYVTNDVQNDPHIKDADWARREGLQSFAGHPLLVGGELVGVMATFAREPLSEVAVKGLATIADAIAVKIRGKLAERANLLLEEQLRQAQKMEAVGRLAGAVAHDFNNMLSVVLSYSEMLMTNLKHGDPILDDIEEIHRAGLRAGDLTRQLLMFSRQQVVEPTVLDLNTVLSGMEGMLRRLVGEDVELTSVREASLGHVRADRGSVEQVVMNLAINARDAMPTGGKLTLETANVMLDEEYVKSHLGAKPGRYVALSITDTGTGMDKETLARIFEPFFTTKEKGKGTGLGLATVFGIAQQSGGSVWVYSEPGIGTTFKVYLPRVDTPLEALRPRGPITSSCATETILVVEDEEQVRRVACGVLRRQGYTVMEARSASEALILSEGHKGTIHLLLTDVVMPEMSGPALAKRLRQTRPDIKVLCTSGYTDDTVFRHGIIDSGIHYLQKPITVENLTTKARDVLDAERD